MAISQDPQDGYVELTGEHIGTYWIFWEHGDLTYLTVTKFWEHGRTKFGFQWLTWGFHGWFMLVHYLGPTQLQFTRVHGTYIHTCVRTYVHTYIHTCIHAYRSVT